MIKETDPCARLPGQPDTAAEDDGIFTIRLWPESGSDPPTETWRGRIHHRGAVMHFFGFAALFDFLTRSLAPLLVQGGLQ